MINDFIREAFDIESEDFKKMWEILRKAEFAEKEDGKELHHIVPVTFFAQMAIASLDNPYLGGIGETEIGKAIRSSAGHYCNEQWNLVYLSEDDHNSVHALMQKCAAEGWNPPSKGASVDVDEITIPKPSGNVFRSWKFDRDINLVAKRNPNAKFILHADKTATIVAGNTIKQATNNVKRNELVSELGLIPGCVLSSNLHVSSIACALSIVLAMQEISMN